MPGGKPEENESDIECLLREFKEEAAGREIIIGKYYYKFSGITPHKGDILEAFVYFAELKHPNSAIMNSNEIDEIRFSSYGETLKMNLSDITSKIIKKLNEDDYI